MRLRPVVVGLGFLLFLQAGCSELIDPFEYGRVEVSVERPSGEGVQGIDLALFSGTRHLEWAKTDSRGRHVFRFVPEGPLGLFVFTPGPLMHLDPSFRGAPYTFTSREGEVRILDFVVLRLGSGSVAVQVQDPEGDPIAGVALRLSKTDPPPTDPVEGETDAAGAHRFEGVSAGVYEIAVLPGSGYVVPPEGASVEDLIVEGGDEVGISFVLEREPESGPSDR